MEVLSRGVSAYKYTRVLLFLALFISPSFAIKKSYVVYMGAHSHGHDASSIDYDKIKDSHHSFLGPFLGSKEKAQEAIFDSYTHHINGFAAILDELEANELSKHPDVVSVFLNTEVELHTTRSWEFMELEQGGIIPESSVWKKGRYGEDTIIGSIDTGVWPESASFLDNGFGPIPKSWKGICQSGQDPTFHCNRKLIGARYFNKGHTSAKGPDNSPYYNSPRDVEGHGTHTLSTAAGNFVAGVDMLGVAGGTAKGGSPRARVAAYRVCYGYCYKSDVLAGFDMAIHDGVDVISASIGGRHTSYLHDPTAIGSFHAMKHGITVVCSAGNDGPHASTASNVAPWQITVGASTMDRVFPSYLVLGNNRTIKGKSYSNQAKMKDMYYPIVSSKSAKAANASELHANLCMAGSLDPRKVKGKILVCLRGINARIDKSYQSYLAGAVGMILANDEASGNAILADAHYLPTSHISYSDGLDVYDYISSTEYPVAYLNPTTELHAKPAPSMASFSSKGPNPITPEILKPDVTAPGVTVIAAFSQEHAVTSYTKDKRRLLYNFLSGTSMSCPHVSGVVGLLKTMHPEWSPSAIKSAIMTSSRSRNNVGMPITDSTNAKASPFSYGAGHIRPNRAMDPGLVYDLTYNDYLSFLCSKGYNETQIRLFSESSFKCPEPMISLLDLNYPSITVPNLRGSVTVSRTLKNVGKPGTYHARFVSPPGFRVAVHPKTLKFESFGEEKTFKVTINATRKDAGKEYVFGKLRWCDGKHFVRSPIVVKGIVES